jgi:hypothetical protein
MFQVQQGGTGPPKYSGPIDVAKSLYREGGLRSVYKGTVATLLRGKHSQIQVLLLLLASPREKVMRL